MQEVPREEAADGDTVVVKMLAIDFGMGAEVGQNLAVGSGGFNFGVGEVGAQRRHDCFFQVAEPLPRDSADRHRPRMMLHQHVEIRRIRQAIDLVQNQQRRLVSAAQFLQDGVDRLDLLLGRGAGGIYDVQK